jgi:hypothetical protein
MPSRLLFVAVLVALAAQMLLQALVLASQKVRYESRHAETCAVGMAVGRYAAPGLVGIRSHRSRITLALLDSRFSALSWQSSEICGSLPSGSRS